MSFETPATSDCQRLRREEDAVVADGQPVGDALELLQVLALRRLIPLHVDRVPRGADVERQQDEDRADAERHRERRGADGLPDLFRNDPC